MIFLHNAWDYIPYTINTIVELLYAVLFIALLFFWRLFQACTRFRQVFDFWNNTQNYKKQQWTISIKNQFILIFLISLLAQNSMCITITQSSAEFTNCCAFLWGIFSWDYSLNIDITERMDLMISLFVLEKRQMTLLILHQN